MSDLFDYIKWRGDLSFDNVPLNKIDALMFAQLSYLCFDGLVSKSFSERKSLRQLAQDFKNSTDVTVRSDMGLVINPGTPDLLYACGDSVRFGDVQICAFESITDTKREIQFAAMTFIIDDKAMVVFRGTDDTIVGWKEDFNIAYLDPIPGQSESLRYLNNALENLEMNIAIAGHSKGGNLAVYSAVNCKDKERIETVFNFDGPGFSSKFFETKEFKEIEPKLKSVYPSFSVVGMIFDHAKDFEIIKSEHFAIMQHDALVWQIEGADFIHEDDFTEQSKFFNKAFNQWIEKLNEDNKRKFIRAVFDVIEATGLETNSQIRDNMLSASTKMLAAFTDLDKETRAEVHNVMKMLRHVINANLPIFNLVSAQK